MVQLSGLVEANVSTTDPFVLSSAEGVYWAFNCALDGENVPVPAVVHIPVVVPPDMLPASCTDVTSIQAGWLGPALATGG